MTPGLPFAAGFVALTAAVGLAAGYAPVGFSLAMVFVFAGPHNWLEVRYILGRLPARAGKLWGFFALSVSGIVGLTGAFAALPWLLADADGSVISLAYAGWNTLFIGWVAALVWLRSRTNPRFDGGWVPAAACALAAGVWLHPVALNVSLVYLHPLLALWLLDRELARSHPRWQLAYRTAVLAVPLFLVGLWLHLGDAPDLPGDDPLTLALARHAGGGFLSGVSTHFLVAAHAFLESVHYGVWVVLMPLVGMRSVPWNVQAVPAARRSRTWWRAVAGLLVVGLVVMAVLWLGFLADYGTTRSVYFTVAMLHVLAEVPFLLRMV